MNLLETNSKYIETALKEEASYTFISIVTEQCVVYDPAHELWFYCNTNNTWKK